ncbi:hypothetical protein DCO58_07380 [Helicobacter saguini]|uniref:Uncharacterized protein n=1 Tax=Helicobacter saguini TaxID=1548018 RepID=A0A347VNA1_9HELI|nr:hypothetical protein [Helicobacter saguini]MWV61845.1 hypothetical protein [Helicobacter saguini]MWV67480.1 hypothetical protein [Helicobacter saguini]MWV69831.1 hypothetical protein [Helicobacter saguini]MWV72951.1 hypothetical protein [Helicobacter saguini]TLD95666.1 hypothetical protein LS64_002100 [Helicobacter saguini]
MQDSIIICVGLLLSFTLFASVVYHFAIKNAIKVSLCGVFILLSVLVSVHAFRQSAVNAHISEYESAFKNKEILICKAGEREYRVSRSGFIYFPDILQFMGKNDNKGVDIDIKNCFNHIDLKELEMQD